MFKRHAPSTAAVLWLLPSFVLEYFSPRARTSATSSKISALDGLRGLSCLAVLHLHWTFAITDSNDGASASANTDYFFHRPFVYLSWAGTSHVDVFFVMSGYVLSMKYLRNIHKGIPSHNIIASAVFRRAIRIFLPPIVMLFCYLIGIQLGMFSKSRAFFLDNSETKQYQIRMMETPPPEYSSFFEQLYDVVGACARLVDPTATTIHFDNNAYDSHLWTMPTEYYSSIALYSVLTATGRLRTTYRLVLHTALVIWCLLNAHTALSLFFVGMTIAEIDLLGKSRAAQDESLPQISISHPKTAAPKQSPLSPYLSPLNILCVTSTIIGLYFLSIPLLWSESTPGYATIHRYMPFYMDNGEKADLIRALGALLTVWPITWCCAVYKHNPVINMLLGNPVAAYLGKVSFALYLTHGFVIRSVGYAVLPTVYDFVISDPQRRKALSAEPFLNDDGVSMSYIPASERMNAWEIGKVWLLGYAVILPVSLWLADLFWRFVDVKCVLLGQWTERKMVKAEQEAPLSVKV